MNKNDVAAATAAASDRDRNDEKEPEELENERDHEIDAVDKKSLVTVEGIEFYEFLAPRELVGDDRYEWGRVRCRIDYGLEE